MATGFLIAGLVVVGTIGLAAIYRQVRFHVDMRKSITALDETHQVFQQKFSQALDRVEAAILEQEAEHEVEPAEHFSQVWFSETVQSLIAKSEALADLPPSPSRTVVFHTCYAGVRRAGYHALRAFKPDWREGWLNLRLDTPRGYRIRRDAWVSDVPEEEWQAVLSS